MISKTLTAHKTRLSVKAQALYTLAAVAAAVAVPQIFHTVGALTGAGNVPGEVFLPMHLPIILVGLLAGPYTGAIAGLLAPVASFALSGMPNAVVLPIMMAELFGYGLTAGIMRNIKMPVLAKVLFAQIGGRVLRSLAVVTAVYLLNSHAVNVESIWSSITAGLPGLILQWVFLPLIAYRIDGFKASKSSSNT